jgi:cell division protein FtsB
MTRLITSILMTLLILIQYPLWWGHGGWMRVHQLEQQLTEQKKENSLLKLRHARLESEVNDLQTGTSAIEERARFELGMIKNGELFVQFVVRDPPPQS